MMRSRLKLFNKTAVHATTAFRFRRMVTAFAMFSVLASPALAQVQFPNVQQGAPGTLINGPIDPNMGRTAVIEFMDGYVVSIPETPGSEPGDHMTTRAWVFTDPRNPVTRQPINPNQNGGHFGNTGNPFLAHGAIRRDNELFFQSGSGNSGNFLNALRLNSNGTLEHVRWSGQGEPPIYDQNGNRYGNEYARWWTKGGLNRPWSFTDNWMYNNSSNNRGRLTLRDRLLAEWDVTADTGGVTGFGLFMGNLLIYASDQRNTGVAVYDATDVRFDSASGDYKPRLLDTLNTPLNQGGIGGYWSEINGHYLVFARQRRDDLNPNFFAGIQVVDFSDPTNLRLHCQIEFEDRLGHHHWTLSPRPQYVGVQDNYAFVDAFKVNLDTCRVELELDKSQGRRGNLCYGPENPCPMVRVDTSQYSRVIGNLWITGGYPFVPNTDGMAVWVHQSAPDRRPPYIAHHVPARNQTRYPANAPLSFSIPETVRSTSIVVTATADPGEAETLTVTEVNGPKVNIDYVISHTGMLTVEPLAGLKPNTTYEVRFTNGIVDAVGNAMVPYSFRFSTGDTLIGDAPTIDGVDVTPGREINVGDSVTVTVRARNAAEYEIVLDSESNRWRAASSRTLNFNTPGNFGINVRARNSAGVSAVSRIQITVVRPDTSRPPGRHSSQLACDENTDRVWATNQDNNSVSMLHADGMSRLGETRNIEGASSAALVANGELWVTARDADRIFVLDANSLSVKTSFSTGYGSQPAHILASNDGRHVYVSLYGSGQLARYLVSNRSQVGGRLALAPTVKSLALSPNGKRLLAARFISGHDYGEVFDVNVDGWSVQRVYRLHKHLVDDALDEGRGVINYVDGVVINGAGNRAYLVAKKDNVDRALVNGLGLDLDDDNMVRTIGMTLDLERGFELRAQRVDFDNTSSPSGLSMSQDSRHLFVAMQGKNSVQALEIGANFRFTGKTYNFSVGLAPQGLCFDAQRKKLFVKNFTDRSVTGVDLANGYISPSINTASTVANEVLSASELAGLKIFYDAFAGLNNSTPVGRMSAEGYVSCASCHIDGGEDGRVYDFSGRGEGLRNTISLNGRGGTRFGDVHWSSNFDEIQDFEHDIREVFRGRGFMDDRDFDAANTPLGPPKAGYSQALDNLAAYLASLGKDDLPRSPHRSGNGDLTSEGRAGEQLFKSIGCTDCHSGTALTDKRLHDVGTLRAHSGSRLGDTLPGIKTPSLLGLFATPPYLHDGSAQSVEDVFAIVGGEVMQAEDASVRNGNVVSQAGYSYLRNARGVRLNGTGAQLRFPVDAGASGRVRLRVRYGTAVGSSNASGGDIRIKVNGESNVRRTISLRALSKISNQDARFAETNSVAVTLRPGNQTLVLEYVGNNVLVDEISFATSDVTDAAAPHLSVASLSQAEQRKLFAYLKQIDRTSAPADDDDDIFSNGPSTTVVSLQTPAPVNEGVGRAFVEARLNAVLRRDVTIGVHTRPGTATNGADFYGISREFRIRAGETSVRIPIDIRDDGQAEGTEFFTARIYRASGASIGTGSVRVSITDDDSGGPSTLNVSAGSVTEGQQRRAVVTLVPASNRVVTVHFATGRDSATPGQDYYGLYTVLRFEPGQTRKTVPITILDDTQVESDEFFIERIFRPDGAAIGNGRARTRIVDND